MSTPDPDDLQVAKIVITRRLKAEDTDGDGDLIFVKTTPHDLPLIEAVGMLRLAEGIVIDQAWHTAVNDADPS